MGTRGFGQVPLLIFQKVFSKLYEFWPKFWVNPKFWPKLTFFRPKTPKPQAPEPSKMLAVAWSIIDQATASILGVAVAGRLAGGRKSGPLWPLVFGHLSVHSAAPKMDLRRRPALRAGS